MTTTIEPRPCLPHSGGVQPHPNVDVVTRRKGHQCLTEPLLLPSLQYFATSPELLHHPEFEGRALSPPPPVRVPPVSRTVHLLFSRLSRWLVQFHELCMARELAECFPALVVSSHQRLNDPPAWLQAGPVPHSRPRPAVRGGRPHAARDPTDLGRLIADQRRSLVLDDPGWQPALLWEQQLAPAGRSDTP